MMTHTKTQKTGAWREQGTWLRRLALLAVVSLCSACGGTKLLMTNNVNFRCDSNYNEGFLLPVDIVFVPEGEKLDTVIGVSPDEWFDSPVREEWPYIQSLSFRETEVRNTVKVALKKAKETIAMVVIADYRGLDTAKAQMVIIKAEDEHKENEDIFITINGLLH